LGQPGRCLDFLQGEARPAPDGFVGFLLDAAGQLGEGLHLIERVSPGEGYVGHAVCLDKSQQLIHFHPFPRIEIPALGVVAALARMLASGTVNGGPETRSVRHCLLNNI